jgi:hypothetical protein
MTKTGKLIFVITLGANAGLFAQDSPSPTETASPTPEQTASPSPSVSTARNVQLRFVPPPMEGTISLGIFDSNDKLVRVLHHEAKVDNFTIDENALKTTWDGKNDAGEDLPAGKYRARGYMVGPIKMEHLAETKEIPKDAVDHIFVKLVINPLVNDTRSEMDLSVGLDVNGSFLKTMDGLPLCGISQKPGDAPHAYSSLVKRVLLTKPSERSIEVWEDWGDFVDHFRASNIDKIMAFDCGFFELK